MTFFRLLDRLAKEPIEVNVTIHSTGERIKVWLDNERMIAFLMRVLTGGNGSRTLGQIPRMVFQLWEGKTEIAAQLLGGIIYNDMLETAVGLWLDCSEEMVFINPDQLKNAYESIDGHFKQYFYTIAEASLNACEAWKVGNVSAAINSPVSSAYPRCCWQVNSTGQTLRRGQSKPPKRWPILRWWYFRVQADLCIPHTSGRIVRIKSLRLFWKHLKLSPTQVVRAKFVNLPG